MAEDVITLLDYIGWKEERGIHIVGTSLGGMIAMGKQHLLFSTCLSRQCGFFCEEMATRIANRIASLTLCVTTAGGRPWTNLPPVCRIPDGLSTKD